MTDVVFESRSFSGEEPSSLRHAYKLIGSAEQPSEFAALGALIAGNIPYRGDCDVPNPHEKTVIFTTATQAIPYADCLSAFLRMYIPDKPQGTTSYEIVDGSIRKYMRLTDRIDETLKVEAEQLARLRSLALGLGRGSLVYVFDEFTVNARTLNMSVEILGEAGFHNISRAPLHAPSREAGQYIHPKDLPVRRVLHPRYQLVRNTNADAVEALRCDMELIGTLAAKNLLTFETSHRKLYAPRVAAE